MARALRVDHTSYVAGSWRLFGSQQNTGAQIDLVIDRDDGIINLCEIKYSQKEFVIDKSFAEDVRKKISLFKEKTKTKKQINFSMITLRGVKNNSYKKELVSSETVLDDLFM